MKINMSSNNFYNRNSVSFSALRPNRTVCDMLGVSERLKLIPNVKHSKFEDVAMRARENALHSNEKPQMLVEIMVRFVTSVEDMLKDGISLTTAFKKSTRQLYKDFGGNQHLKDTYSSRWDYLAKAGSNRHDGYVSSIKPNIEPTNKNISFTYTDVRDMLEFLRKNWSRGNAAYRNVMLGDGPMGWIKYLREELFPNHYDEFFRKY